MARRLAPRADRTPPEEVVNARWASLFAALVILSLGRARLAHACPDCRLGREVRASVLAQGFWSNVVAAGSPVAAVFAAAGLLYRVKR
jgi:hypothetical protein